MSKENIVGIYNEFKRNYKGEEKKAIWRKLSERFRKIWNERILNNKETELLDAEIDEVVKVLDVNAKGHVKGSEAVARVMIAQGAWRRMFREIHSNRRLSATINNIFVTSDRDRKASYIDELYEINKENRNNLTGPSGNAINSMLAAYDPIRNSSMVSLKDRKALIEYMNFPWTISFEEVTIGKKIVETNEMIHSGFISIGIDESARTITNFCYSDEFRPLWKKELTIRTKNGEVTVIVPDDDDDVIQDDEDEGRESIRIQALLAEIGSKMGMEIWVPKSDRVRVLKQWKGPHDKLINVLPLNYDDTTIKTIEQIDILWLRGRSIIRAFEIEHTTAIYSGILRMADLLALQPNMAISLHIVAPLAKRDKVFQEIRRPVFSLLERGPLEKTCTYLSYDRVRELFEQKNLAFFSDKVLDTYAEKAE